MTPASLPNSRASDGRPSQSVCSELGTPPEAKSTDPGTAAAALPDSCFPQCGHDAASVDTCCLHSGHATRAIRSSYTGNATYALLNCAQTCTIVCFNIWAILLDPAD